MRKFFVSLLSLSICFLLLADKKKAEEVKKIGSPAPAGASVKEVEVRASKGEFNPAVIEVPAGTLLRLHLKSTDKEHGFELKTIKDSCVKFKPDAPITFEFYADKAAEYEFKCCKFCGGGHGKMKGKLVVE